MSYISAIENERPIFMNICKSLNEMVINRKYRLNSDKLILYDLHEIDQLFTAYVDNKQSSPFQLGLVKNISGVSYEGNPDNTFSVVVFIHLGSTARGFESFVSNFVTHSTQKFDSDSSKIIDKMNYYDPRTKYIFIHRSESRKNDGIPNLNIFYYKHVCFNITRHIDQPLFVLLRKVIERDQTRINQIYETYNLSSSKVQTAEMKITDPVAQWFGALTDDIFVLYRKRNPTDMNSMYIMNEHIIDKDNLDLDEIVIDADVEFRIVTKFAIKKGQKRRF
jgi:hypothetical protein